MDEHSHLLSNEKQPQGYNSISKVNFTTIIRDNVTFLIIVCEVIAIISERLFFKVFVDNMAAFPHWNLVVILLFSVCAIVGLSIIKHGISSTPTPAVQKEFPNKYLLAVSATEALQLTGIVFTAPFVQPFLTVVLFQLSIPSVLFWSSYIYPTRVYTKSQISGAWIVVFSVCLGILVPVTTFCWELWTYWANTNTNNNITNLR